jgi:hypothetical protein
VGGGDGHREAPLKARDGLRCEPDLRDQAQGLFAPLDHGLDDAQIDLGLAASGHALEQEHLETFETGRDLLNGIRLAGGEHRRGGGWTGGHGRPGGVSDAGGDGAHPPKRAGEGLGHDLPERMMIIVAGPGEKPELGGVEDRSLVQDLDSAAQFFRRDRALVGDLDQKTDAGAGLERHAHPMSRHKPVFGTVGGREIVIEAREGEGEGDPQDAGVCRPLTWLHVLLFSRALGADEVGEPTAIGARHGPVEHRA